MKMKMVSRVSPMSVGYVDEKWTELRHHFYKSSRGEYHVCGRSCDRTTSSSTICPVSKQCVRRKSDACIAPRVRQTKLNSIFSILWDFVMNGKRERLHKQALAKLRNGVYGSSSFETLVCVQREYHALTKSYYPYTWPEVLRHTIASQIQTLALMILRLYRTKSTGLSGYNLKSGAVELAYIISQGLTMNNAVIFDRNYFMLSALPPLENTRSTIRNKIMNFIRTSPGWNTIRSIC